MTRSPRRWIWRIALAVTVVAIAALATTQYRTVLGALAGSTAEQREDSCLPGRSVPLLDSPHVSEEQAARTRYNSVPATSGPHYAFAANTGIYSSPVPEPSFVHTMEHGHVVIAYSPTLAAADVHVLEEITRRHSDDVLLTPYPGLEHGVALAAWGRLLTLDDADEPTVVAFVTTLAGRYDHGWLADPCH
ncbi:DUF3105 domain-containing protein [Terrabacter sp. MAHUQ-38]|jgi:hypothetical protein|uniref:DUF3105 domain-containing protein n=1 Tax=unclassified Terrabacter TaxID=2630222 RepID=UPI00165DCB8F|nr:DUF3105 domain-containing protein [Terrabacter sp. MAHUQ-38]MBC9822274.1 DUF3105 domain-containing protein [Terrabacter sp. MAHUQ-38]